MNVKQLQQYNKAYVPVIAGIFFLILAQFGISSDMTVEDLVYFLITALAVYFVPNKGKK